MIAENRDRPVLDEVHHGIDSPFRIGAIADDIAKADDLPGAARACGIEAGLEGLPVGMNVGKDGQPQLFLRTDYRASAFGVD
jgi:hypothetical protein